MDKELEAAIDAKRVELEDAKQAVLDAHRTMHIIERDLYALKLKVASTFVTDVLQVPLHDYQKKALDAAQAKQQEPAGA